MNARNKSPSMLISNPDYHISFYEFVRNFSLPKLRHPEISCVRATHRVVRFYCDNITHRIHVTVPEKLYVLYLLDSGMITYIRDSICQVLT